MAGELGVLVGRVMDDLIDAFAISGASCPGRGWDACCSYARQLGWTDAGFERLTGRHLTVRFEETRPGVYDVAMASAGHGAVTVELDQTDLRFNVGIGKMVGYIRPFPDEDQVLEEWEEWHERDGFDGALVTLVVATYRAVNEWMLGSQPLLPTRQC
jgi:hypothetical protein